MRDCYVVIDGIQHGPFNPSKIRAMHREGRIGEDAELYDAVTGDLILLSDILEPGPVSRGGDPILDAAEWHQSTAPVQERSEPGLLDPGLIPLIAAVFCWPLGLILALLGFRHTARTGHTTTLCWVAVFVSLLMGLGSCISVFGMYGG